MRCRMLHRLSLFAAATLAWIAVGAVPGHAAVPAGFTDILVTSVGAPTAITFTPDGRLLITQKTGSLRVFQGGLLGTPALTIPAASICTASEQGLLGVAVHPSFASNRFIYLFYTFSSLADSVCVNRVSRFTLPDSNVVNPATELVLVDNMPSPAGNHNAGDVHFGKDGYLYISIGEGGISSAARNQHVLTGKILRITDRAASRRPIRSRGRGRRAATSPGARRLATDVRRRSPGGSATRSASLSIPMPPAPASSSTTWGRALGRRSTRRRQGRTTAGTAVRGRTPTTPRAPARRPRRRRSPRSSTTRTVSSIPGTTSPTNCNSITGGAFVPNGCGRASTAPTCSADFICGEIFKLTSPALLGRPQDFGHESGRQSAVHMTFGPHGNDQALYYTTFAGGGQVRVIAAAPPPDDFFTLTPCRVADTRDAAGPYGGPALAAGSWRTFVLNGVCGIPPTARAVAVNLTVIAPTAGGHLILYPGGTPAPPTSTINFALGATRANNAVALLGAAGDVGVLNGMASGSVHFALDVVGYFE